MSRSIPESDWKLFRQLHPVALNRYCERVLAEIGKAAGELEITPHERFLKVYELVRDRNRSIADAFNDFRRSTAVTQLAVLHGHGLITAEELSRFSQETRERISMFGELR